MRLSSLFVTGPLGQAVLLLGVTQVIGYGTLYYAFPILAPAIVGEFGIELPTFYAVFSVALLAGGLTAPRLGKLMDIHGAPRLMMIGSILAAILMAALALSPGLAVFGIVLVIVEVVSFMVLYDAAFATLAHLGARRARRAITFLTLIAGFASTVFWPVTGWLVAEVGWRWTVGAYALLHLCVALPLHWRLGLIKPQGAETLSAAEAADAEKRPAFAQVRADSIGFAFTAIAISFALTAVVLSALSVQMVPVLQSLQLGAAAYFVAMAMGPAQVSVRITDALFWQNMHPLDVALISGAAIPLAIGLLFLPAAVVTTGLAFAICFGVGQGLSSIVRGSVPLTLFGPAGFGARLGQLALVRILMSAGAPFLFATLMAAFGTHVALGVMIATGILALVPLLVLRWRLPHMT